MFEEIQHFGVTVRSHARSRGFYAGVLRMPLMSEIQRSGPMYDRIYGLEEAVNLIGWYQLGCCGLETFHLPRHPSPDYDTGDMRRPGFRYMAFRAAGFDEFARHLERSGAKPRFMDTRAGRCAALRDPDGTHVLIFDSGRPALVGHVTGLKELGLVAADTAGYEEFFDLTGLRLLEDDCDFTEPLFGACGAAPLYGHVRLIPAPEGTETPMKRCFPATEAAPRDRFSNAGIKHVAYTVADADAFHRRCAGAGVSFFFQPFDVPGGGSRIIYFADPEGNTFEAMQLAPGMREAGRFAGALRQAQISLFSLAGII